MGRVGWHGTYLDLTEIQLRVQCVHLLCAFHFVGPLVALFHKLRGGGASPRAYTSEAWTQDRGRSTEHPPFLWHCPGPSPLFPTSATRRLG